MEVEIKSKFDAEFRRVKINPDHYKPYDKFREFLHQLHNLGGIEIVIQYIDELENSLLPINNDDNYARALSLNLKPLRIILQKKGSSYGELHGYGQIQHQHASSYSTGTYSNSSHRRIPINKLISALDQQSQLSNQNNNQSISTNQISLLEDFRRVSAIIDVDVVPVAYRRVKLMRNSQKPLGFYIRDGSSVRASPQGGIENVPGVFISRLVPKGLADSTGLLAVNDEIIEVNGIEVRGKTLDQVTDMMVANSSNLIITVRPANQNLCLTEPRVGQNANQPNNPYNMPNHNQVNNTNNQSGAPNNSNSLFSL